MPAICQKCVRRLSEMMNVSETILFEGDAESAVVLGGPPYLGTSQGRPFGPRLLPAPGVFASIKYTAGVVSRGTQSSIFPASG
jgi:hypothetical protein